MNDLESIASVQQRRRGMRPDALRFVRPDAERYIKPDIARFLMPGTDPGTVFPSLGNKYRPDQRRISAGQSGGGRWVDELVTGGQILLSGIFADVVGGAVGSALSGVGRALGGIGESVGATADSLADVSLGDPASAMAFAETSTTNPWTELIGDDPTAPVPIPNADVEDIPANLEEVNARRGNSSNGYFPGASTQQLVRLDQAIARSENALTQIRQYDVEWRPSELSLRAPGSIEGSIRSAEARAVQAETRLYELRSGIGGNLGPALKLPSQPSVSRRAFDGGAWIDAYRGVNNAPDLFGRAVWPEDRGTVAVGKIDGDLYFGVNSTAPGYDATDRSRAVQFRGTLISKYPFDMDAANTGGVPNDGLFHAETTILLRAASDHGWSLSNRSIEITVDREVCYSCGEVLPRIGMEIGNPYVRFIERTTGYTSEMWNGRWLSGRYKR